MWLKTGMEQSELLASTSNNTITTSIYANIQACKGGRMSYNHSIVVRNMIVQNVYPEVFIMTKIELLKEFAKGWFGNSQQHSIHAQLLKQRGFTKLGDKIMAESDEEWEEAKKVNARLIELGETPVVAIQEYPVITDIKEMLEYDCKDSAQALPEMSKSLAMFEDDYVTKAMIQQFIIDEQEHFNWVRQHLNLIEEIGYENYLLEQLG